MYNNKIQFNIDAFSFSLNLKLRNTLATIIFFSQTETVSAYFNKTLGIRLIKLFEL